MVLSETPVSRAAWAMEGETARTGSTACWRGVRWNPGREIAIFRSCMVVRGRLTGRSGHSGVLEPPEAGSGKGRKISISRSGMVVRGRLSGKSGHSVWPDLPGTDAWEGRGCRLRVAFLAFLDIKHCAPQWLSWIGPALLLSGSLRWRGLWVGRGLWYMRSMDLARGGVRRQGLCKVMSLYLACMDSRCIVVRGRLRRSGARFLARKDFAQALVSGGNCKTPARIREYRRRTV